MATCARCAVNKNTDSTGLCPTCRELAKGDIREAKAALSDLLAEKREHTRPILEIQEDANGVIHNLMATSTPITGGVEQIYSQIVPSATVNRSFYKKGNRATIVTAVLLLLAFSAAIIFSVLFFHARHEVTYLNAVVNDKNTTIRTLATQIQTPSTSDTKKNAGKKVIVLESGTYIAGRDFDPGTYDISVVEGYGNVFTDQVDGVNLIMGTRDLNHFNAVQSYSNAELLGDTVLTVSHVKIKLTLVELA